MRIGASRPSNERHDREDVIGKQHREHDHALKLIEVLLSLGVAGDRFGPKPPLPFGVRFPRSRLFFRETEEVRVDVGVERKP